MTAKHGAEQLLEKSEIVIQDVHYTLLFFVNCRIMFDEVVQIKAIRYFELMFYAVYFYFVSFLKQSEIVARFIGFLSGIAKSFVSNKKRGA